MMDCTRLDAALQTWVDSDRLPGASYLVVKDGEVAASGCVGWADREAQVPLRPDHLFRIFSNTKLVTSLAALQLMEQGRLGADDPIGDHIPELSNLRVLRPGATSMDDTAPAREPVRVRHLLTHTAGMTYAFLQPDLPIAKAYMAAGVSDHRSDLPQMMRSLAGLPLLFEPGSAWNYSVSIDIVGRLVEVVSGLRLDDYFRRHIFEPLSMHDTFFVVPPEKQARLTAMYMGNLREPTRPGLRRVDHLPYVEAYRQPAARLNPGGGLVSTLGDFMTLVRTLLAGGAPLLRRETMPLVLENQLLPGQWIGCPGIPAVEGRGHSFAGSVTVQASIEDPTSAVGELQWGGLAGTKWSLSPRENLAVVLMTQRYMGSDLAFWPEFKGLVREGL